jgi:formylglycine-generating enzyme required for sulfatase activity
MRLTQVSRFNSFSQLGRVLLLLWMVLLCTGTWGRLLAKDKPLTTIIDGINFEFVRIHAGKFKMGAESPAAIQKPKHIDLMPAHKVKITKNYQIGRYEVTMEQWDALMDKNPSSRKGKGTNLPVDSVTWEEVQEFINRLNQKDNHHRYRLPTEAEWEYACRAGQTGDNLERLNDIAWWNGNSGNVWKGEVLEGPKMPLPVGSKQPNAWGLYDMPGNVWEWVQDWYGPYSKGDDTDPQGPASGTARIFKGGSWLSWGFQETELRPSYRDCRKPSFRHTDLGFRLVRTPK